MVRSRLAFGNRTLQDDSCIARIDRPGQSITKPTGRSLAPEIFESNDASSEGRSRHTKHSLGRAQLQTRSHCSLASTNRLSMHLRADTQYMYVEAPRYRRAEAGDDMDLGTRNRHQWLVAITIIHQECRHHRQ